MTSQYNFSAGPAMLPPDVLLRAQKEMLDWQGSGMSVMEMSHRGNDYQSIALQAETDLRDLMAIPDHYKVLFLQGGASSQFSMVPMNLFCTRKNLSADYINTGVWSGKAINEASKYGEINIAACAENTHFTTIPAYDQWQLNDRAAYVHYTPNETINGVEFQTIPATGDVPLVADMSSTILSRPIEVSKFGIIYAGAQKNIGPAGLTLVIIRDDLIGEAMIDTPTMFDYATQVKAASMYNTPPTYAWYLAGLVFQWLKAQGGLTAMAKRNEAKANKLYDAIDQSDFYHSSVDTRYRSWMNIPFTLANTAANTNLDQRFLHLAEKEGLMNLKGYRSMGGMRASIYNAMPEAGVDALIHFMQEFEATQT